MGVFDFVKEAGASIGLGDGPDEKDDKGETATKAADDDKAEAAAKRRAEQKAAAATAARKERLAESKKSKELEEYIGKLGFDVENLDVRFDDGVADVSGKVSDKATKEKIIVAIGNTEGVGEVNEDIEVAEAAPAPTGAPAPKSEEMKTHVVVRGDTLSHLAQTYYGDASKYPVIFEANRPMLSDPNKIYVGQVLRIPAL